MQMFPAFLKFKPWLEEEKPLNKAPQKWDS
jgi:hypothetical protein